MFTYLSDTSSFNMFQTELYDIYNYFKNENTVLAQSLSGFNAALLQRIQGYQFPINNSIKPLSSTFGNITNTLAMFGSIWNTSNPFWRSYLPPTNAGTIIGKGSPFLPLRAGTFSISKLQVVDVFGQFIPIIGDGAAASNDVLVAQSMKIPTSGNPATSDLNGFNGNVYMAPRIVHPMRLRFLWESSTGIYGSTSFKEYNPHPAYSPVCGWLMHNQLDNTLFTYDIAGEALGYFIPGKKTMGEGWRSVPKSGGVSDNTLSTDIAPANKVFQNFLTEFVSKLDSNASEQFFTAILGINQYLIGTAVQESASLAILKGHPLVLTQANIKLDAYGTLPVDTGALTDNNNTISGTVANVNTLLTDAKDNFSGANNIYGDIQDLIIPVNIGNDDFLYDGLVGYFINGDFSTFYTTNSVTTTTANGVTIQTASSTDLKLSLSSPSVTLTLVMDPRVPVHATSGILPQQKLQIPTDEYEKAMNNLKIYFSVYPTLLSSSKNAKGISAVNYKFPLPKEPGYKWSWAQPALSKDQPLQPNTLNDKAAASAFPLEFQDGWLKMSKDDDQNT